MAVVEVLSQLITNRDAVPRVINQSGADGAAIRGKVGVATITSGNSSTSKYRMFTVPSRAVMHELRIYSPDIGTTTIADIGLYKTTADGGAVVDADFFASAVSLKDGALNGTDVLHEAAVFTIANSAKPLWEALGLSADPNIDYDVVLTLTADADATGVVALKGQFGV